MLHDVPFSILAEIPSGLLLLDTPRFCRSCKISPSVHSKSVGQSFHLRLVKNSPTSTKLENNGRSIRSSSKCEAYSPVVHFYVATLQVTDITAKYSHVLEYYAWAYTQFAQRLFRQMTLQDA